VSRGRRQASLPPVDFIGEPNIAADGMTFTGFNEDGTETCVVSFANYPGARQLRVEITAALAKLNGPRGVWRSVVTLDNGQDHTRLFLKWLDTEGHRPSSVGDITVGMWDAFVLGRGSHNAALRSVRTIATVLKAVPTTSPELVTATQRRFGTVPTPIQESYSEDAFRRIRRQSRKVIHTASLRISRNYDLLLRYRSGALLKPSAEAKAIVLGEILDAGQASTTAGYEIFGAFFAVNHHNNRNRHRNTRILRQQLFLTPQEAWAAAVLLAVESGWNRSVIDKLDLPDNSVGAGDAIGILNVTLHKPRRARLQHSSTTELATNDVGRALDWIVTATEPAREALQQSDKSTDRLLVYDNWGLKAKRFNLGIPYPPSAGTAVLPTIRSVAPDLFDVSFRKLRRTHQVVFDKSPTLNTRRTHQDTYVRNDQATHDRAVEVVTAGLTDAVANAETYLALRVVADTDVSEEIRSGRADTAIAACNDFTHHPISGRTCTDSFLACLGCSNSVATPRHLSRLVLLYDALEELGSVVSPDDWRARWELHFARLNSLLDRYTTEAERIAARNDSKDSDRLMISRLLAGGFSAA
jgi:hypothetical protein